MHGDRSEATSYTVDRESGRLAVLNRQPTGGYNPIHLAFDAEPSVSVVEQLRLRLAGRPADRQGRRPRPLLHPDGRHRAARPAPLEQKNVRPHHNPLDRVGRTFYLPCKGSDCVIGYRLDAGAACWSRPARVTARPSAGPRTSTSIPRKPLAYVINELDSTITTYRQDPASGALTPLQTVPSTPSDFTGYSTGAEIWVDGAGRNVYVSNRGHDSIGVFGIDAAKGTLAPRQWVPTKGGVPRFFAFDPAERFLYVANQGGDSIIAYKVGRNGLLAPTRLRTKVGSPACIVFSR